MKKFVAALALAGVVDAISYMVVAPSIIFYVIQSGGSKEQYGIILSAFSFASFCTKPFLGRWSDTQGFRRPYITSLLVAMSGGLLYLAASAFTVGNAAVYCILFSRLLGGVGAASSALGFAYVARVVPHDDQTSVNSLLSTTRLLGMAVGPGVNFFIAGLSLPLFHGQWKLDDLNVVGLIVTLTNACSLAAIIFLLEEVKSADDINSSKKNKVNKNLLSTSESSKSQDGGALDVISDGEAEGDDEMRHYTMRDVISASLCADILVPFLSIFTFNANFQLIETGLAPAASDALGWKPVQISAVFGVTSVAIMVNMILVSQLSSKLKVSDGALLTFGLTFGAVSYTALFLLWKNNAQAWHFYIPMICASSSFPFLAAQTRSVFTRSVDAKPVLNQYRGFMQALLSMGASVAGFVPPGLIAAYCLREPQEVAASRDGHQGTVQREEIRILTPSIRELL